MAKMKPSDVVDGLKIVMNILKGICEEDAIAGIILTEDTYGQVLRLFGPSAHAFKPSNLEWDSGMEMSFVVDGVLFLKGNKPQ